MVQKLRLFLTATLICATLSGCSTLTRFDHGNAKGYRQWNREECVPYARRVSGINIHGDAWTWWNAAAGKYQRGNVPMPGAVLVLAKTGKLQHGHLAVVSDVLAPRDINVTHTNWGNDWVSRRVTYEAVRAQDMSPNNDWTQVRFWNDEVGKFGFAYPAYGFIYNARPAP